VDRVSTRRALAIGHSFDYDPGFVGEAFAAHGYELTRWNRESTDGDVPDPTSFDVIIPFGSAWSSWNPETPEQAGATLREQRMLADALAADIPILAVCFGMQQLAFATGGSVALSPKPEIGTVRVIGNDDDPYGLTGDWTTFHVDSVTPPPGAVILAETDVCVQSFSIGSALAVQFHPEAGGSTFGRWVADGGTPYLIEADLDPSATVARVAANEASQRTRTRALVDAFLRDFVGAP
jgi:GMP synthase-like glutamine amidotransferase